MKKFLVHLSIILLAINGFAQDQHLIDSLQTQLKNHYTAKLELEKNTPDLYDTTAANIFYELSIAYWGNDPEEAMVYAKQVLELSEQIGFKKGMGNAFNSMGTIHAMKGEYSPALESFKNSVKIREEIGDKPGFASGNNNIGNIYWYQGNYPEALKNYFTALKISEEIGDKKGIASSYNSIGMIYHTQGNYLEALKNYFASLKIKEGLGDKYVIAVSYNNIGVAYSDQGNYPEALKNHLTALKIREEIGDKYGIASCYDNIGGVYDKQVNYPEALKNFFTALRIQEEIEDKQGIAGSYRFIGSIYIKQKKYSDASGYLNKGLSLSKEIGSLAGIKESYDGLATSDSSQGDYKQALEHYKLFIAARDSLVNSENTKKIAQQQMQYDFDKKELLTKAVQDKKDAITSEEISKQKIVRNFSIASAVGVLFLGGFVFYNFRKRKKLENQRALADERLRISRDLHDDMGASLSSISVFSLAVKQKLRNNETHEAEQLLDRMSTDAQEMVAGMSEMVWTISPHNDTVEKLAGRLQLYGAAMLSAKNILFSLSCDAELNNKKLSVEARKNIFLILKEAINNAAKYSNAAEVKMSFAIKENCFIAELADNGKGFDISAPEKQNGEAGNGLKNMNKRAAEIESQLEIISEINKGTSVTLVCLLPKIGEKQ